MHQIYEWKRLWQPYLSSSSSDNQISNKFLYERKLERFFLTNYGSPNTLVLLEEIDTPYAILLGEPGMGKTYELRKEEKRLIAQVGHENVLFFDLEHASEYSLNREVFDSKKFQDWKQGENTLYILLDSFDRSVLEKEKILRSLLKEAEYSNVDRLRLRIACRELDWSRQLQKTLNLELYVTSGTSATKVTRKATKDSTHDETSIELEIQPIEPSLNSQIPSIQIYKLLPLDLTDIELASNARLKDNSGDFVESLYKHNVLPLAQIPITLDLLIEAYITKNSFPTSRLEIYETGCEVLIRKSYDSDSQNQITLTSCLQMVRRIMATLVLTNNTSVFLDKDVAFVQKNSVFVEDLIHTSINEELESLQKAVSTTLFTGSETRTWIHRNIAEFLTAQYLIDSEKSAEEIAEILSAENGKFIPQLIEVVRWLIALQFDRFVELVAKKQPEIVINMDLAIEDRHLFHQIIENILNFSDEMLILYMANQLRFRETFLEDSELAEILKPYLLPQENKYKRRFALTLIYKFQLVGLDDELISLVYGKSVDYEDRSLAAKIIASSNSELAQQQIKSLIAGVIFDPNDELKGAALLANYPQNITAQELFDVLTPPQKQSFYGTYKSFLYSDKISSSLNINDLPIALKWVAQQETGINEVFSFQELINFILEYAWVNIHDSRVLDAFADTVIARISHDRNVFGSSSYFQLAEVNAVDGVSSKTFLENSQARHSLVNVMAKKMIARDISSFNLLYSVPPLVILDDLDWLLAHITENNNDKEDKFWGKLVWDIFRSNSTTIKFERILSFSKHSYYLSNCIAKLSSTSEASSTQNSTTERVKSNIAKINQKIARPISSSSLLDTLSAVENGDMIKWVTLVFNQIMITADGRPIPYEFEPDISQFPGWRKAHDNDLTQQILVAAKKFLTQYPVSSSTLNSSNENWLQSNAIPYVQLAAYHAIFLLIKYQSHYVWDQLTTHDWRRLANIIIWFPLHSSYKPESKDIHKRNVELQQTLVRAAWENANNIAKEAFSSIIEAKNKESYFTRYDLANLDLCWGDEFEAFLLSKLTDSEIVFHVRTAILEFMLEHKSSLAKQWAEEYVGNNYSDNSHSTIVASVAIKLIKVPWKINWTIIWNALTYSDPIGKRIIEELSDWDLKISELTSELTESEIADLFIWVYERYPKEEDPQVEGMHTITTREAIGMWRDALFNQIRIRNTVSSKTEIDRIAKKFPDAEWLQYARVETEQTLNQDNWIPPTVKNVVEMDVQNSLSVVGYSHEGSSDIEEQTLTWTKVGVYIAGCGVVVAIIATVLSLVEFLDKPEDSVFTPITPFSEPNLGITVPTLLPESSTEELVVGTLEPEQTEELDATLTSPSES